MTCEVKPEAKKILRDMAAELVRAGHTDANDILDRIHDAIKDHTPLYKSEIAEIVSGHGEVRKQTKSEMQTRLAEIKKQLRDTVSSVGRVDKEKHGTRSVKELREASRRNDLRKQMADLQRKIDTGDFSKPVRTPIEYTSETNKLAAERDILRKKAAKLEALAEYKGSSKPDKLASTFLSFRRAIMLSSVKTLAKLSAAASYRVALSPIEHGIQGTLAKLPGLSRVAEKAPIEGRFSPRAEGTALKQTFSKKTFHEMKQKLLEGHGTNDVLFGKDKASLHPLLDMIGQAHAALKTPAERNAFARAQTMATEWEVTQAVKSGMQPNQVTEHMQGPMTQAKINMRAFEESQRAVLKNPNFVVKGFQMMQHYLRQAGAEGSSERTFAKSTANVMDYVFPIVHVPTNFAGEGLSYAAGALKTLPVLKEIMSKGVESLSPDQADYVMRNLGKQTIGAVVGAIGWYGYKNVGSFYQPGDNKRHGIPASESAFGLPKWAIDTPLGIMLTMGATMHRISDSLPKPHGAADQVGRGVKEGYAAVKGMAQNIPFFDEPQRLAEAFRNTDTVKKFAGQEVAHDLIPPDVGNIARMTDPGKGGRASKSFTDQIKESIPGLREQVPMKRRTIE